MKTLLVMILVIGALFGCGKKKDLTLPPVEVKTYTIVYSLYTKNLPESETLNENTSEDTPVTIVYKQRETLATARSTISDGNENTLLWTFVVEKETEAFMRITFTENTEIPANLYASAVINTVKKDGGEFVLTPVTTIEKHITENGATVIWKK